MQDCIISEIRMFGGNFAPRNWAFCQGQQINISQNASLFSLLGTAFGGNGTTIFNLPDLGGRVAIGTSDPNRPPILSPRTRGETGGNANVTLVSSQMPAHSSNIGGPLTLSVSSEAATEVRGAAGAVLAETSITGGTLYSYHTASPDITLNADSVTVELKSVTNGNIQGGGAAHNNMMPYIGLNYIICLLGIFPSRG